MLVTAYCPHGQRHKEDVARGKGKAYVQIDRTLIQWGLGTWHVSLPRDPERAGASLLGLTVVKVVCDFSAAYWNMNASCMIRRQCQGQVMHAHERSVSSSTSCWTTLPHQILLSPAAQLSFPKKNLILSQPIPHASAPSASQVFAAAQNALTPVDCPRNWRSSPHPFKISQPPRAKEPLSAGKCPRGFPMGRENHLIWML
jgi:hypothetical protein